MMSGIKYLTLDEEFRWFTGIIMNNWFALKVITNNSNEPLNFINLKVKGLFQLLLTSTQSVINNSSEWTESVEAIEDYFDDKFNTFVEDDSCDEVLHELVNFYNLLLDNKRESLCRAIFHLSDKRDIFTLEEYNPEKVVRVAAQSELPRVIQPGGSSISDEKEEDKSPSCSLLGKRGLLTEESIKSNVQPAQSLEAPSGSNQKTSLFDSTNILSENSESRASEESSIGWEKVTSRRKKRNM